MIFYRGKVKTIFTFLSLVHLSLVKVKKRKELYALKSKLSTFETMEAKIETNELMDRLPPGSPPKGEKIRHVFESLKEKHTTDWLLPMEIYELAIKKDLNFSEEVLKHLLHLKLKGPKVAHLIDGGLALLEMNKKEIIN